MRSTRKATDYWLLSYPRSGRNWLINMLGLYSTGQPQNHLWVAGGGLPDFDVTHVASVFFWWRSRRHPRYPDLITHRHGHKQTTVNCAAYNKRYHMANVFNLIRDPRDCSISLFMYYRYRMGKVRRHGPDVNTFLRSRWGLPYHVAFLNRWVSLQHCCRAYQLLSYEQLVARPAEGLSLFLEFCFPSVDIIDQKIRTVVDQADLAHMRDRDSKGLIPDRSRPSSPSDSPLSGFCVHGRPGGWFGDQRIGLTDDTRRWVEDYIDDQLDDVYGNYKRLIGV